MKNTAFVFKALGDSTRMEIIQLLMHKELCVCDILNAFTMSQPAISHHLSVLRQAEVVLDRKEGKWVFYRLNPEVLTNLEIFIGELILGSQNVVKREPCANK